MRKICLALPTDRECCATIAALGEEAARAAGRFGAEVHLLILDSAPGAARAAHARAVAALPGAPGVVVHHLDEPRQRAFLDGVVRRAAVTGPGRLLDLMLPDGVSYGACTNRAFLFAAALGCVSVHRRDSDSRYQTSGGEPVRPLPLELAFLGRRAADAAREVTVNELDARELGTDVMLVGGSFVGELSVDVGEIAVRDPDIYHDLVSLWAPADWSAGQRTALVAASFRGAGQETYTGDRTVLTHVDALHVDMCNIAFHHHVYERVPLSPARDTIGSDYVLIRAVHGATLPGVRHNRHIVNFHTPQRRTRAGFLAYQMRYVRFILSMLYFHPVYDRMAAAGSALLDAGHRLRPEAVVEFLRESTRQDTARNTEALGVLDRSYRRLGGRYGELADLVAARAPRLLAEARTDIEEYVLLIEGWEALVRASRAVGPATLEAVTSGRR
ncbi:DUF6271 family protein [Streptomyces clavuligerus]|uniref:Uncharacterized protein n=1 Tax=Streptomyces clavuligerus TaxID=1901 RepID=B5H0T2_STRCL|nr:DUF6271 family protein [Streptomyces clavuligerus]ANW21629.1 hypothetical protein BB341_27150 [Streptomyces clavuligerus]AXU16255.1 hypothetical protein D1794_28215 [Streptomyces clavuligerus]EDY52178.1 conserved hypothetical protein [Streptomyces clavuligerus]EFG05196.1 Hypothetical protein SCLAV_0120 [Streptomyces clavuligerus]MBY6306413.1 hypothetical protein [Streptomyces clavuligerus]